MDEAEQASQKRLSATRERERSRLTPLLFPLCLSLAVLTLVPWSASIPNHLGYYSLCSFAPVSTLILLTLALGIWSYSTGHQRALKSSALAIVMLIGFSGFWGYTGRMPIADLQFGIQFTYVHELTSLSSYTGVGFNLTFYNPTDVDTPPFDIESFDTIINGTRLVPWTYEWFPSSVYSGVAYIFSGQVVRAHETKTYSDLELIVYWNFTETEGGELSTVLLALNQSRFSMTFGGLIVARTSYSQAPVLGLGLIIAAAPFEVSYNMIPHP